MSAVDRVRQRRTERDYEAPIPGEKERQANLVANAPWDVDVTRLSSSPTTYSPDMFSNPALTRASAVTPSPVVTPAEVSPTMEQQPRIAPDAYKGIALTSVADVPSLPSGGPSLPVGNYRLHPMMAKQSDGSPAIAYYVAYNVDTKKSDYVVGPRSVETFRAAHRQLENLAALYNQNGWRPYEQSSARVVDQLMKHGFDGALAGLKNATKEAVCDPVFWGRLLMNVVTSAAAAKKAPAAAAELEGTSTATQAASKFTYKEVNPGYPKTPGTTKNCVNCAVATDATLGGNAACAARTTKPLTGAALEAHYGRKLVPINGPADVEAALKQAAPRLARNRRRAPRPRTPRTCLQRRQRERYGAFRRRPDGQASEYQRSDFHQVADAADQSVRKHDLPNRSRATRP
jgi:hypothetical protein